MLPFNRHVGLRLPWTVQDEEIWNLAHRILGLWAIPLALLYVAGSFVVNDFDTLTLAVVLLWIGVPGGLSLLHFWKKYH